MRNLLFFFLLIVSHSLSAQVIVVTDEETSAPLELVNITSMDPIKGTITNSKGQANFSDFQGLTRIRFNLIGYKTRELSYDQIASMNYTVELEKSGFTLDQIVISANKTEEISTTVPQKISVIDKKFIALQQPQTAADLLSSSGEVFIQKSQQGGGSPMIRGFSTNRLLYAVDGVRMNTAIFRSGNLQNVISLDPFATESAEVLFGPGSIMYGSDAIGGVMSFTTLTPQLAAGKDIHVSGTALSRFSSVNDEKTGHFHFNVGWQKWAILTSVSHMDFGDLRMGKNGPDEYLRKIYGVRFDSIDVAQSNEDPLVQKPTAYTQTNLMQKIRWKPSSHWDIQYAFHYSETSPYSRYDRLIRYRNGVPRSAEWNYGPQIWMMNQLTVQHKDWNRLYDDLTIRLAHQRFEESRIDRDWNDATRRTRTEEVGAYSLNLDAVKRIGKRHKFFYGVEGVMNQVNSFGTDEDIATGDVFTGAARYPKADWQSLAAYTHYKFQLSQKINFDAGVRYNTYDLQAEFQRGFYDFPFYTASVNNAALTGSTGVTYSPNDKWQLYLNLGTGFRSPNVDDIGKVFDSGDGVVVVPNAQLRAEYAYNGELGITKVFDERLKLQLTGYYTLLNDALVRRDFQFNGQDSIVYDGEPSRVQAIQNAAQARVYGIQAGADWSAKKGWNGRIRFNYQIGEEEFDDGTVGPSRHAAPFFGVAAIGYHFGKLQAEMNCAFSGEKSFDDLPQEERDKAYMYASDKNGNPYSPAWYTLNIKANYLITNYFSVNVGLENITDVRYKTYSSGIAAGGRNFIIGARANF